MHNDSLLKVSENTLIPKLLMAFKNLGIGIIGFSKKPRVSVFNGITEIAPNNTMSIPS